MNIKYFQVPKRSKSTKNKKQNLCNSIRDGEEIKLMMASIISIDCKKSFFSNSSPIIFEHAQKTDAMGMGMSRSFEGPSKGETGGSLRADMASTPPTVAKVITLGTR